QCDFCRQKKLKCSRELPKCNSCKPWPGDCNYSRDNVNVMSVTIIVSTRSLDHSSAEERTIVNRVQHLEQLVQQLTQSVDKALQAIGSASAGRDNSRTPTESHQEIVAKKNHSSPKLYIGSQPGFLELAELGTPFFNIPSDDEILKVVFEPHKVREKAWVVYFNYMLLSAIPAEDGTNEALLRQNVQLALNESSIFLEPREANVQALAFLAMHGEDYAAPNMSWMLLGNACRQAEALGMHLSSKHESQQQQLCLFWLLFLMDKSCSLAFGRPAFLPTALYHNVPLPGQQTLLMFQPHTRINGVPTHPRVSQFGAQLLRCSMELAKLMGILADVLVNGQPAAPCMELRSSVNAWYSYTNQRLTDILEAERASSTADQVREMTLGINSMKFQYLHVLILLLKGDGSASSLRLSSAREAISLLKSMVSNWHSVNNGVMWHLLYYPFTSFFVIFENIVHHPGPVTPTKEHDLNLLATTVTYFASMRSQMRLLATLCTRLEHVANTFLQLARNVHCASSKTMQRKWHGYEATGVDLEGLDVASYLDWLPADIEALPGGEGPSGKEARRTFDSVFDWFSWDAYYGDPQ
ncbi:uncharacterized protein BO97DRAFT_353820, partial [Aspergillus homomorphus CBS 101889]